MEARHSELCLTYTQITLEWPQRHGELAFGAAVNLLERLDSVNDIEEKALREGI